jgi:hypothetical protein
MRAAALALTVSAGCSFVFTSNPPPPCNPSSVAPIADTAATTLAAIATLYLVTEDETLGAVATGGFAIGFSTSAIVGYQRVGRCRAVAR